MIGSAWTVLLGPGLAAGFAGLGALMELDRRSIPITRVVGVNTGAFVAALWAVGSDLSLAGRVAEHLPWDDFFVGRDLGGSDPLLDALRVLTREQSFEDCRREALILAVDMESGASVRFERGSLAWAIRHSMAIPGVFEPISQGGRRYGDGGLDRKGIDEIFGASKDRVVAFWPSAEPMYEPGRSLPSRIAAYAARAWGPAPRGPGHIVNVKGPDFNPIEFHLLSDWVAAGRRAAADWLAGADQSVGDEGRS